MVKVTQEQKRTLKKFVALGLELGTLGSYDIWEIHYLLTHTNPGIADNDRAPHPANTADEYGPYHAGSMMGVNLGTNGMWEIWHRARDIAANEAEKNEIDKMARSVFIQIAQLGAERHRLKVEDSWPGLLVEDEGGYAMTEHDPELRKWLIKDEDRRRGDFASRVCTTFLGAIRESPDGENLVCRGVLELAGIAYAHWKIEKRLAVTHTSIDWFPEDEREKGNWDYFDDWKDPQIGASRSWRGGDVAEALERFMAAYKNGIAPFPEAAKRLGAK